MVIVPWRVKAYLSNHFPLAYHLAVNLGPKGNSQEHWDRMLEETWDDAARTWPTKVDLVESLTEPGMKILDVACGTGSILRELKRRGQAFIFVPDQCLGPISEPEHVIVYRSETLRTFLARHFVVERVEGMRDANHQSPILFAQVRR